MADVASEFADLLERVRRGDNAATAILVEQYEPKIRIFARVLLGPALRPYLDSVDLVQSVHRSLMMGLRNDKFELASPENLVALTLTMVRRKAARQWRRMRRQRRLDGTGESSDNLAALLTSLAAPGNDPSGTAQFNDQVSHLWSTLRDDERRLLELRLDGYSPAEAAEQLNLSAVAFRVRLTRLRQKLRAAGLADDIF